MEFEAWWKSDKDFYSVSQGEGVGCVCVCVGGGGGGTNGGSEEILQAALLIGVRSRTYGLLATSLDQGNKTTISSLFILWGHFLGYPIQSSFRSLEIPSNWRYRICICSVILGDFELFRNY